MYWKRPNPGKPSGVPGFGGSESNGPEPTQIWGGAVRPSLKWPRRRPGAEIVHGGAYGGVFYILTYGYAGVCVPEEPAASSSSSGPNDSADPVAGVSAP